MEGKSIAIETIVERLRNLKRFSAYGGSGPFTGEAGFDENQEYGEWVSVYDLKELIEELQNGYVLQTKVSCKCPPETRVKIFEQYQCTDCGNLHLHPNNDAYSD